MAVVKDAELAGQQVRAIGSGWSFSDAAATDGYLIDMRRLSATLMQPEVIRDGDFPAGAARAHCHVEAGVSISVLSRRLARSTVAAAQNAGGANYGCGAHGWALAALPGASGQTLAGAIATGTHGTDQAPPLADWIRAVHLVGAGGFQRWIEPDMSPTAEAALLRRYPGIEVHRDRGLLRALQVSLGRFGIIYAVVIEVVEQYRLHEVRTATTWRAAREHLSTGDLFECGGAVQVVIGPYADAAGEHTSYITTRTRYPHTGSASGRSRPRWAWNPAWIRWRPSDLIGSVCNLANRAGRPQLTEGMVARVLALAQSPSTRTGVGHELLTRQAWVDTWCRGHSVEIFLDATTEAYLDVISLELLPILRDHAMAGAAIAGWVSLRFTNRSGALLAMQRWNRTVAIEVASLRGIEGTHRVLRAVEDLAVRHGGTVHWGQLTHVTSAQVNAMFPGIDAWRAELRKITPPGSRTFSNSYCLAHGVELESASNE